MMLHFNNAISEVLIQQTEIPSEEKKSDETDVVDVKLDQEALITPAAACDDLDTEKEEISPDSNVINDA
jgi:hypothetical protein